MRRKVFRQIEGISFFSRKDIQVFSVDFEERFSSILLQKALSEKKNMVVVLSVNGLNQEKIHTTVEQPSGRSAIRLRQLVEGDVSLAGIVHIWR